MTLRAAFSCRTHTLTIDNWHPRRTNEWAGKHWAVRHRMRKAQSQRLWLEAYMQGVPKASGRRRVSLTLHGFARWKFPDADAYDKLLLDSLVEVGLLTDDSCAGLDGRVQVQFVRSPTKKTVLILEDQGLF